MKALSPLNKIFDLSVMKAIILILMFSIVGCESDEHIKKNEIKFTVEFSGVLDEGELKIFRINIDEIFAGDPSEGRPTYKQAISASGYRTIFIGYRRPSEKQISFDEMYRDQMNLITSLELPVPKKIKIETISESRVFKNQN